MTREIKPVILLATLLLAQAQPSSAAPFLSCDPTQDGDDYCAQNIRAGSICHPDSFVCTNPFQRGCLSRVLEFPEVRVCSSQDLSTSTIECNTSIYPEIRIAAGSDDASLILAWIYQILLMEPLRVPVAIVASNGTGPWSFYQELSAFPDESDFDQSLISLETLETMNSSGGCSQGETCAHLLPLVRSETEWHEVEQMERVGTGLWGQTNLYIPQKLAQQHPELVSFYGLQQKSRSQLSNLFPKPYNWQEYCEQVSLNSCEQADAVALRAPSNTAEEAVYYQEELYNGYFFAEDEDKNNGVGHVIAPPCARKNNFAQAQMQGNQIALESQGPLEPYGGYEVEHMVQIWKAANATQSNVMMWWWSPDSLEEAFRASDYSFVPVQMAEPTPECIHSRSTAFQRCSRRRRERNLLSVDVIELRNDALNQTQNQTASESEEVALDNYPVLSQTENHAGDKLASCGDEGRELEKIIASTLRQQWEEAGPVERSPAYETIRNLLIASNDLENLLGGWGRARYQQDDTLDLGYQAREYVCVWVAEHLAALEAQFPSGYPRVIDSSGEEEWSDADCLIVAQVFGGVAAVVVMLIGIGTVHWKERLTVVYAQAHFVWQILLGFWFVSMAAVLLGKEPNDSRCLLSEWLVTLGFTLILVPMMVKIATINHIAQTIRKQEQAQQFFPTGAAGTIIRISNMKMFMIELSLSICILMYLMVWTNLDPPSRTVSKTSTGEDGNVIETTIFCSSKSDGWIVAVLCWQAIMAVCATILVVCSKQIVEDFKESTGLEAMIYCQALFLALRVVLFLIQGSMQPSQSRMVLSFLLSFSSILSCAIYFAPLLNRMANADIDDMPTILDSGNRGLRRTFSQSRGGDASSQEASENSRFNGFFGSSDLSVLIRNRLRQAERRGSEPLPLDAECQSVEGVLE